MNQIEMDWLRINCIDNVIHYGYGEDPASYAEHTLKFGEVSIPCWVQTQPIVEEAWDFVERILQRFLRPFVVDGKLQDTVAIDPETCLHLAKIKGADMTWWAASCLDLVYKSYRNNLFLNIANPNQMVMCGNEGDASGLEIGQQPKLSKKRVGLEFVQDGNRMVFRPWTITHPTNTILNSTVAAMGHYRRVFYPEQEHKLTQFGTFSLRRSRRWITVCVNGDRKLWRVRIEDSPTPIFLDKDILELELERDLPLLSRIGYFTRLQYARTL